MTQIKDLYFVGLEGRRDFIAVFSGKKTKSPVTLINTAEFRKDWEVANGKEANKENSLEANAYVQYKTLFVGLQAAAKEYPNTSFTINCPFKLPVMRLRNIWKESKFASLEKAHNVVSATLASLNSDINFRHIEYTTTDYGFEITKNSIPDRNYRTNLQSSYVPKQVKQESANEVADSFPAETNETNPVLEKIFAAEI
jgi:hypothetical protein